MAGGGGLLGVLLGYSVIAAFRTVEYPTDIPLKLTFELDSRALAVAIAAAILSAVLSSLLPAWRARRTDLVSSLKATVIQARSHRSRLWGRSLLVCVRWRWR